MTTGRGSATTWPQRYAMLEWLEIPANFRLITGDAAAGKAVVAGTKLKKSSAYEDLATFVNNKCSTNWDKQKTESRYKSMLKTYKDVKREYVNDSNEKFGIGPADVAKGYHTIAEKLEGMCPSFERLDNLFGSKQNVTPSFVTAPPRPTAATVVTTPPAAVVGAAGALSSDSSEDEIVLQEQIEEAMLHDLAYGLNTPSAVIVPAAGPSSIAAVTTSASTPSVTASVAQPTRKRSLTAAQASALTPQHLQIMASASVDRTAAGSGELADKITNIKKGKTDFGYSYAEAKKEENSLNRDRFDWEKSNHMSNHESQMKIMKFKQESDSNTEIMKALIAAGKSPDECAEYLQKFKNMSSH